MNCFMNYNEVVSQRRVPITETTVTYIFWSQMYVKHKCIPSAVWFVSVTIPFWIEPGDISVVRCVDPDSS